MTVHEIVGPAALEDGTERQHGRCTPGPSGSIVTSTELCFSRSRSERTGACKRGEFDLVLKGLRKAVLRRVAEHDFTARGHASYLTTFIAQVGLDRPLTRSEFCVGLHRLLESFQHLREER
jgi:hypothetical protein